MYWPEPVLIVFSGLPGVGKTTIARELGRSLAAVYLRIDSIEHARFQPVRLVVDIAQIVVHEGHEPHVLADLGQRRRSAPRKPARADVLI